jgi:hypothetical protein
MSPLGSQHKAGPSQGVLAAHTRLVSRVFQVGLTIGKD